MCAVTGLPDEFRLVSDIIETDGEETLSETDVGFVSSYFREEEEDKKQFVTFGDAVMSNSLFLQLLLRCNEQSAIH